MLFDLPMLRLKTSHNKRQPRSPLHALCRELTSRLMKRRTRIIRWLWRHFVGSRATRWLIRVLSYVGELDLLTFSYNAMGILKYENNCISGEHYFIFDVLTRAISDPCPTLFDVGANQGDYSAELRSAFAEAELYAFEPNPHTFKVLQSKLSSPRDHTYCIGLGTSVHTQLMYTYADALDSQHASLFSAVFSDLHHAKSVISMRIQMTALDEFCLENSIAHIDFLKIDTEGYELEVLRGAKKMLDERQIDIIQFEFNETHVASRVFLRDFYAILHAYNIYRLDTNRLIPLFDYDARNEIFQFQNFVAILKTIAVCANLPST